MARSGPKVILKRLAMAKSPTNKRRRREHIDRLAVVLIDAYLDHVEEVRVGFDEDSFCEALDALYGTASVKHFGWDGSEDEGDDDEEETGR